MNLYHIDSVTGPELLVYPCVITRLDGVYLYWSNDRKGWTTRDNATTFQSPAAAHAYYEATLHGRYVGRVYLAPAGKCV